MVGFLLRFGSDDRRTPPAEHWGIRTPLFKTGLAILKEGLRPKAKI